MGPLLFLICVNNISNSIKDIGLNMSFANAIPAVSTLYLRCSGWHQHQRGLSKGFQEINCLLNCAKTKCIVYSRTGRIAPEIMAINIQGLPVETERVDNINYLGIIIVLNLSFKSHIIYLRIKLSRNIRMMNHLKFILPFLALKSL